MVLLWRLLYNLLILPLIVIMAYLLYPFNRKIRRGLRGRRKVLRQVSQFMEGLLDRFGPLYWFHVASHGEYEQTRPVVESLREIAPESIIVVSFFSPSGYDHCHHNAIDLKFYLPLDFPWNMRQMLRILRPRKVIFTSYDLWPNLVWSCWRGGVSSTLFAARVLPGSSKLWPVISNFYRHIFGYITHIYTISEPDLERVKLIVGDLSKTKVKTLGNPRYDRVKQRIERNNNAVGDGGQRIVVMGSLHKSDEDIVSAPMIALIQEDDALNVFWAPHEPTVEIVHRIGKFLTENHISWGRYSQYRGRFKGVEVLIVDGIGYLAELYSRGMVAFVGGGFGSNVHNVMEPAIARIPVLFGPKYARSHEAEQLIECGGGISVSTSDEFLLAMRNYIHDDDLRTGSGDAAFRMIEENLGATARTLQALLGD